MLQDHARTAQIAILALFCAPLIVPWWMSTRTTRRVLAGPRRARKPRQLTPAASQAVAVATDFLDTQIIRLRPVSLDCFVCLTDTPPMPFAATSIIGTDGGDEPFFMVAACGKCGTPCVSNRMTDEDVAAALLLGSVDRRCEPGFLARLYAVS